MTFLGRQHSRKLFAAAMKRNDTVGGILLKTRQFYKIPSLEQIKTIKWNTALYAVFVGSATGILVALYRLGIEYGTDTAENLYAYFRVHPIFILPWIAAAIAIGLLVAWLIKLEPLAAGSGIPEMEGIILFGIKMRWYSILIIRFLAGLCCGFFGLSLGREGPSIQIGAASGQALSKGFRQKQVEEKILITSGAAAGLAAAFNAPLSGAIFALEEVHRNFSPNILIAAVTASVFSDVVTKYCFGLKPILDFAAVSQLPVSLYFWLIPLGVLAGLIGSLMNKALLGFHRLYDKMPSYCRPVLAILIALPCGLFIPLVLGSGEKLIRYAEAAQSGILILLVLLVIKLLFTCTSFSSGVPGGIFMPILAVGTLLGSSLGIFAVHMGMSAQYIPVFAICAMSGALSSCVKAPITAILLTTEMSGSFIHMLPVLACSFLALLISDMLKIEPIYEALMERYVLRKKAQNASAGFEKTMEFPVELGSNIAGCQIGGVSWPEKALVVKIRRGEKEIVPHGDTTVMQGDYLVIVSSGNEKIIREQMQSLCHVNS